MSKQKNCRTANKPQDKRGVNVDMFMVTKYKDLLSPRFTNSGRSERRTPPPSIAALYVCSAFSSNIPYVCRTEKGWYWKHLGGSEGQGDDQGNKDWDLVEKGHQNNLAGDWPEQENVQEADVEQPLQAGDCVRTGKQAVQERMLREGKRALRSPITLQN